LAVDSAQGYRPRHAALDDLDRLVKLERKVQAASKVVEGAERKDAEGVTGSRQAARYSTDGSVAARYDDSRLIRQKLRDALIRGKVQVCVVWKGSPQEHLHLVGHGAGPWVDQEKLAHTRRRGPNRSPKTGSSLDAESELFVLFPPRPKNARRETNTETSTLAGLPSSRNRNARLSSARELRARHPRHTPASRSTLRSIRSTSTSPTMVS
jgi:hypothetical protein